MVAVLTPVLGAATAVLALASGRNMWQTYSICNAHDSQQEEQDASCLSVMDNVSSQEKVLERIQSMPRNELLELFLSSDPPTSLESINGEWNGILLNNNIVLTTVTNFLTNGLFGMGRKWNGKAFYKGQQGTNRFHSKADPSTIQTEHQFDFSIAPSRLDPNKSSSVMLIYSKYQNLFSLWKTMVDELRVLKLPGDSSVEVMICMGCMGWSGGMLNASPFCLWRSRASELEK